MKLSVDDLPVFFEPAHAQLAERLRAAAPKLAVEDDRAVARALGETGLFELVVPSGKIDTRALCLAREMLGYVSPRADSIFAVQGLGTHPLILAGSDDQRAVLPEFAKGEEIAAFALTEPEAGSDVAAIATRATTLRDGYKLDGEKLFI